MFPSTGRIGHTLWVLSPYNLRHVRGHGFHSDQLTMRTLRCTSTTTGMIVWLVALELHMMVPAPNDQPALLTPVFLPVRLNRVLALLLYVRSPPMHPTNTMVALIAVVQVERQRDGQGKDRY